MDKVGIFAFAWGQQGEKKYPKAGPSNYKIAILMFQIYMAEKRAGNEPMVAAQWKTSLGVPSSYIRFPLSQYHGDTHYIDTKTALDKGIAFFQEQGVKRVVFVAHPLHLFFINMLVKSGIWRIGGIEVDHQYDKVMRSVPYDQSLGNVQWWTRGPIRFVAYMMKAFVTKKHGA